MFLSVCFVIYHQSIRLTFVQRSRFVCFARVGETTVFLVTGSLLSSIHSECARPHDRKLRRTINAISIHQHRYTHHICLKYVWRGLISARLIAPFGRLTDRSPRKHHFARSNGPQLQRDTLISCRARVVYTMLKLKQSQEIRFCCPLGDSALLYAYRFCWWGYEFVCVCVCVWLLWCGFTCIIRVRPKVEQGARVVAIKRRRRRRHMSWNKY